MCTEYYAMWYIFRQLRSQQRIQLHICLFLSFVLTCVLKIMWDLLVYNDRIHNPWQHTFMVKFEVSFSASKHFRVTIEPPAKRLSNDVLLVGRWWPADACLHRDYFAGIVTPQTFQLAEPVMLLMSYHCTRLSIAPYQQNI